MQTDFAERVGKAHGLERGLQGSPARHERVQRAYAHLSDPQNFYKVYDVLRFPSSIREVQQALGLPQR